MDWPDIKAARELRARIAVPSDGEYSLRAEQVNDPGGGIARAIRGCLSEALAESRTVIWTTDVLMALSADSVQESMSLQVLTRCIRDGMQSRSELWIANRGCLVAEGHEGEALIVDGLLLMRHGNCYDPFPAEDGVVVAGVVRDVPQLVFWWPVDVALGAVISSLTEPELSLAMLAIGHWAGMGLAARACGAIGVTETEGVLVAAAPAPKDTVKH